MEYKLGDKINASKLGLTGRALLTLVVCESCKQNKWARKGYEKNHICASCYHTKAIVGKKLNNAPHRDDCKCGRCRIGKGYFKGRNNPMWKGGIKKLASGYVYVFIDPDHKFYSMVSKGVGTGYVAEHRLVMAESIGRPLLREETVHHKNGIRNDNRIENLELWKSNHNSGQRLEDQILWAIEILTNNNYTITKNQSNDTKSISAN